jgi:hypothetical protein
MWSDSAIFPTPAPYSTAKASEYGLEQLNEAQKAIENIQYG